VKRSTSPILFALVAHVSLHCAQNNNDLSLMHVARDDSSAVVQITYWGEDMQAPGNFNVEGTGFLVGREGYFNRRACVKTL
jgi:hypothetical protein